MYALENESERDSLAPSTEFDHSMIPFQLAITWELAHLSGTLLVGHIGDSNHGCHVDLASLEQYIIAVPISQSILI